MNKAIDHGLWRGLLGTVAIITGLGSALAQTTKPPPVISPPPNQVTPPTQLNMPLMSVDQGQHFQQVRTVQASSVPARVNIEASAPTKAASSLVGVNGGVDSAPSVKPRLGHALPASTVTPLGFPRADFAIDSGLSSSKKMTAGQSSKTPALSNAVIQ